MNLGPLKQQGRGTDNEVYCVYCTYTTVRRGADAAGARTSHAQPRLASTLSLFLLACACLYEAAMLHLCTISTHHRRGPLRTVGSYARPGGPRAQAHTSTPRYSAQIVRYQHTGALEREPAY